MKTMGWHGIRYLLTYLLAFLTLCPALWATPPPQDEDPLALVCWLTGEATIRRPATESSTPAAGDPWQPLALFERLFAGSEIRTASDTEVVVVFFDGRRSVVEASSWVVIGSEGARVEGGSLRQLEAVPAMAEIPRLARPGKKLGADRIRDPGTGRAQPSLYPRDATLLIDDATLRFSPFAGDSAYRVEVIDERGDEVFVTETEATAVHLPGDRLEPGAVYYWRVRNRLQSSQEGAFFMTLSASEARGRQRLAEQASQSNDPLLQLLLAEVDHSLGLRREACAALPSAALEEVDDGMAEQAWKRFGCGWWEQSPGGEPAG